MFVRFRQTPRRLQLSLVETRREGGKVRHEHIASLGALRHPPEIADRVEFWTRLHERLARLGSRLNSAAQGEIFAAVHARVPIPGKPPSDRALLKQSGISPARARLWCEKDDVLSEEDIAAFVDWQLWREGTVRRERATLRAFLRSQS